MPAEIPDKLLSGDICTSSTDLTVLSDSQTITSEFSTETTSNLSETDSSVAKLTDQDLEDLKKIQAELYNLASNFPETSTISTTSAPSFSSADSFIDSGTTISLSEPSASNIISGLDASNLITVSQEALTQNDLVVESLANFSVAEAGYVTDAVVSTNVPNVSEPLLSDTTTKFSSGVSLSANMLDQTVNSNSTFSLTNDFVTTTESSVEPELLPELASEPQPTLPNSPVSFPTSIIMAPSSPNSGADIGASEAITDVVMNANVLLTGQQIHDGSQILSATTGASIQSNVSAKLSVASKTNVVSLLQPIGSSPAYAVATSGQPLSSQLTMVNVTNTSTLRTGKPVFVLQKQSVTSTGGTILTQSKLFNSSPTKMTPVLTTAGSNKLVPVTMVSSSGAATITMPLSSLKDMKVVLPQNTKGHAQTVSGVTTLNNFNFIQTVGGKPSTSGQILSKVKIVNAASGTQFAQMASGGLIVEQSKVNQKSGQQPTILLASPNKTLFAKASGTQILRSIPGTITKQGVVLLSPVKGGKLAPYTNMTVKSPTRIAPAPNSAGSNKVTLVASNVPSGHPVSVVSSSLIGSTTTSIPGSPQKLILRPVIPANTKVTGANSAIRFATTGAPGSVRQIVPISGVLTSSSTGGAGMIQVPGNKFNYVRLVTAPTTQGGTVTGVKQSATLIPVSSIRTTTANLATMVVSATTRTDSVLARPPVAVTKTVTAAGKPIVALPSGLTKQVRLALPIQAQTGTVGVKTGVQQRLLIPSSSKANSAGSLAQFPAGSIISSGNTALGVPASYVMVSAQYVAQLQQQGQTNGAPRMVIQAAQNILPAPNNTMHTPGYIPIAAATIPRPFEQQAAQALSNASALPSSKQSNGKVTVETTESRPRKPCNCTKSQCLKLYCDCFANGEFCNNCNCTNCYNNLEHEEDRQKAIKSCLERNPMAFHPKIGKSRKGKDGDHERRHTKGCNCKRSGCLKNYCECYEAKILCTNLCKCNGCKNFEDSSERKTLMHLADAAEVRVQQQAAAKTKISSQIQDMPMRPTIVSLTGERLPFSFITDEVTEATCDCLLARAEEGERLDYSISVIERQILEEFGRCLVQVIDCANKTRGQ